jgi:hypothetical protein
MKNAPETGGPAFPRAAFASSSATGAFSNIPSEGMTLRDWFAGQALTLNVKAEAAYEIADAMLKARGGG